MMIDKNKRTRMPAVAGQFYDADSSSLDRYLSGLFADIAENVQIAEESKLRAVISPHAGYLYSGKIAAKVFTIPKGNFHYKRAVIIAPSHRVAFSGLAASDYSAYRTPLGDLQIDLEILEELSESPAVSLLNAAHKSEHALEVQLPFLQKILRESESHDDFKIVPLICGKLDDGTAKLAAEALLKYWTSDTLWIISSDFTHYGASFGYLPFTDNVPENIRELDMGAIDRILELDYEGFSNYINQTGVTICGANPIKLLLKSIELSRPDDKVTPQLIDYTNSGELTGDYSHCVSYAGVAFFA